MRVSGAPEASAPATYPAAKRDAPAIPIFYDPKQNVSDNKGFAPWDEKPRLIYEAYLASGLPVEPVSGFAPLTVDELCVCHDRRHVERVLSCQENNGFGNTLPSVAASLPWECGAFQAAAERALADRGPAFTPASGFHHADYYECWNFCSFNGLTISAILLKEKGLAKRVGIIDFDCHWGNGTDSIIEKLGLDFIEHLSFGKFKRTVRLGIGFDAWLAALPAELKARFASCDVLFYQAGADAHIDDRFGGFLSTEQLRLRDQIVFEAARDMGLPIVWNSAGGYQEPVSKVIGLHLISLEECAKAFQ